MDQMVLCDDFFLKCFPERSIVNHLCHILSISFTNIISKSEKSIIAENLAIKYNVGREDEHMEKTEAVIYEEQRFLQLCGQSYKDKIQKKQEMTLNDFNRIYCVLMTLEMSNYAIYFAMELFPELLNQSVEERKWIREKEDMLFSAEDNLYAYLDQYQQWLYEFWNQMPLEAQKEKYKEVFGIE